MCVDGNYASGSDYEIEVAKKLNPRHYKKLHKLRDGGSYYTYHLYSKTKPTLTHSEKRYGWLHCDGCILEKQPTIFDNGQYAPRADFKVKLKDFWHFWEVKWQEVTGTAYEKLGKLRIIIQNFPLNGHYHIAINMNEFVVNVWLLNEMLIDLEQAAKDKQKQDPTFNLYIHRGLDEVTDWINFYQENE